MARAAGRDVLLQLMEAVGELQGGFARQGEVIERITARLDLMVERSSETAEHLRALDGQVRALSERVDGVSERVGMLSAAFTELSEDQTSLRQDFVSLALSHRETRGHLDRIARILRDGFTSTSDRLDDVEQRLARLEKKTG